MFRSDYPTCEIIFWYINQAAPAGGDYSLLSLCLYKPWGLGRSPNNVNKAKPSRWYYNSAIIKKMAYFNEEKIR
jgi:hypothetical protein